MTKEQVLEFLNKEENKGFLKENNFQTEIEKKVEVPGTITEEAVTNFLSDNQGYKDKLHNNIVTEFLKKRTGKEEIKPEDLGSKLILEGDFKTNNETFKKALIEANMKGVKNHELLMSQIDSSKIDFKDGKLEGFGEQYEGLKNKYPDMFDKNIINTPKAGGGAPPSELTYEEFIGMSKEEKRQVPTEVLNELSK